MGLFSNDKCSPCGVRKGPFIKVTGTFYELGTCRTVTTKVCPDCYVKIKNGESSNFTLNGR